MIDFASLRDAHPLPAMAARFTKLRPVGKDWLGCCPFHADRSPSFTVFAGGRRFHCLGCGASGDVVDFVARAHGLALADAARMLGGGDLPTASLAVARPEPEPDRSAEARAIWQRAVPAAGTLAEAYLRWRGLPPPYPPAFRFLALPCGNLGPLPCLVAAVQDVAGNITGIQRIWLAADGRGKADVPKPKRSLGRIAGGAIRLGELDESGLVTVCEGPEDGLSLVTMLGGPVWVAAGASMMPALQFPPTVRSVIIGADNDPAGRDAADRAAKAYAARGLTVRIIYPLEGCKDFNDELRGAR